MSCPSISILDFNLVVLFSPYKEGNAKIAVEGKGITHLRCQIQKGGFLHDHVRRYSIVRSQVYQVVLVLGIWSHGRVQGEVQWQFRQW